MEDLNDLAIFASVVSSGSFSAAAKSLAIPKSRVSRRVAELEQRLGVRLLQRSTRVVRVTDVGAAFFSHCEVLLEAARAAVEVAEHASVNPSGRVRVSTPMGVAHLFLAPILTKFIAAHPEVRIELEMTNRRVDVIAEGFDVALRVRSVLDDSNLVIRTFGISTQVIVASPEFIEKFGPFPSPESLNGVTGVGYGGLSGGPTQWQLHNDDGKTVEIDYHSTLVTDDVHIMMAAALGGSCVAVLPFNVCANAISNGDLVILFPEYRAAAHKLHAVFPSRRGVVPAVRAFIEFLAAELPSRMDRDNNALEQLIKTQSLSTRDVAINSGVEKPEA
ncbi:DNA-binding transcriptional LysR family regulator [Paraburkholderia tropica]|uniref:LysR family transcriptional regulator n=1 Tax=Paraburkholderia tropica TaxID=92647 RepID=UPI00161353F3|nr:LysR family transcriptional regulator [Paraburkholderia tropica]MBB3003992.1 DNA-binding transcriptional LysR family regulator [Paraburkholderia tropica]MBB6323412.1 DNA-binding transcriptional LysR family regulator [Paraburkholderia tropica]